MTNDLTDEWPQRIAILGVGLLGGSVAKSIRRSRPHAKFIGYVRDSERRRQLAELQLVDELAVSVADACRDCDVVVVATPVDHIAALVIEASSHAPPRALITDVGSTKAGIVREIEASGSAVTRFVPAHPIAGSEKSSARHASGSLFDEKMIVITPTSHTDEELLQKADRFWRLTGGKTVQMSPDEHDAHLAAVSHVPHFVSALVAMMIKPGARSLVGSGWQDITRVAAGDPTMWTAICKENRAAIHQEFKHFRGELDHLLQMIDAGDDDALESWLAKAKRMKEQTK